MPAAKDLTGKQFGRLTAINPTERRDSSGCIIWAFRCDCGKPVEASGKDVVKGRVKSCGCAREDLFRSGTTKRDLTGQRFGRLVVVRDSEKRSAGAVVWECRCDCGNVVFVRRNSLTDGETKSCGCLNKEVATGRAIEKVELDWEDGTRLPYLTQTMFKNNTSGVRGVHHHTASGLWVATIGFKKKNYFLGAYKDKERAIMARKIAEEELWKPFLEDRLGHFETEDERKKKLEEWLEAKIAEKVLSADIEAKTKNNE